MRIYEFQGNCVCSEAGKLGKEESDLELMRGMDVLRTKDFGLLWNC